MAKKNPAIIRKGDLVEVVQALCVERIGRPKSKADYRDTVRAQVQAEIDALQAKLPAYVADRLQDACCYAFGFADNFGGTERTVHTYEPQSEDVRVGARGRVTSVWTQYTGRYDAGSRTADRTDGSLMDVLPSLIDRQTHRIAHVVFRGPFDSCWSGWFEVCNLRKVEVLS